MVKVPAAGDAASRSIATKFTAGSASRTCIGGEPGTGKSLRQEAMEFLQAALAGGPVPGAEVKRMAREHGLTPKTARSARAALKVKITRDGLARAPSRYGFSRKAS